MMRGLGKTIADNIGGVVAKIGELIARMLRPFVNAAGWLVRHVADFVAGLVRGVLSMLGRLGSAVGSVISTATRPFVNAGSWLVRRGLEFVGGLIRGITGAIGSAVAAARRVATAVLARFADTEHWLSRAGNQLIQGLLQGAINALSGVGSWVKRIGDRIVGAVKGFFGIHSPSTVFAGLGGHMITGLIKGMLDKNPTALVGKVFGGMPEALRTLFTKNLLGTITSLPGKALSALGNLAGSITGAAKGIFGKVFGFVSGGGGGVGRWLPTVLSVLNALHQPASLAGAVLRRIQFESGGNPNAINLTDINAQQGHPSQGLVQTIPGTFFAYAGSYAGRGITDPFANIYAGMNYALHRYGSIAAIDPLVRPRGYDKGGLLPPGLTMAYNGTGQAELILTQARLSGAFTAALRSWVVPWLQRIALGVERSAGVAAVRTAATLVAHPAVHRAAVRALSAFQVSNLEPDRARFSYVKAHGLPSAPSGYKWAEDYTLVKSGFYDSGGWLPPGLTMAVNGTGRPERIRTARQEDGLLAELRGLRRDLANLPVAQVDERYVRRTQRYMNGRDPNGW
jgi:hypothetical protein